MDCICNVIGICADVIFLSMLLSQGRPKAYPGRRGRGGGRGEGKERGEGGGNGGGTHVMALEGWTPLFEHRPTVAF